MYTHAAVTVGIRDVCACMITNWLTIVHVYFPIFTVGQRDSLKLSDLPIIMQKLWDARAKWKLIGMGLGIDSATLDVIERDNRGIVDDCFSKLLSTWLSKADPQPTKSVMDGVLRSEFVKCKAVADEFMFNCSCGGSCRLQSFFEKECPAVNSHSLHVRSPSPQVVDHFNRLTELVQQSVCKAQHTTDSLIDGVNKIGVYSKVCRRLEGRHNLSDVLGLRKSQTVIAAFGIIKSHISFFNFELLQAIAREFCQGDDSIQKHMESYKEEFDQFCKHKVAEVPSNIYAGGMGHRNIKRIVVSTAQQSAGIRLSSVYVAKEEMAERLGLNMPSICLHRVDAGKTMTLLFAVPEQLANSLLFTFPRSQFSIGGLTVRALICGKDEDRQESHSTSSSSSSCKYILL